MTKPLPQPLQRLLEAFRGERRLLNLAVAAGVAGMLLIALSEWLPAADTTETAPRAQPAQEAAACAQQLEERLQTLIAQVEGAGETRVMVTLAESARTIYAADRETDPDGCSRSEHLLLDGADPPALVESTLAPQVQGVAVLCAGGGDAAVQAAVTDIVKALTGVGASDITVGCLAQTP